MTKNTPFFSNFASFCTPKRCTRLHCLVLKNNPNNMNFFTMMISNFKNKCPPPSGKCQIVQFLRSKNDKKVINSSTKLQSSLLISYHRTAVGECLVDNWFAESCKLTLITPWKTFYQFGKWEFIVCEHAVLYVGLVCACYFHDVRFLSGSGGWLVLNMTSLCKDSSQWQTWYSRQTDINIYQFLHYHFTNHPPYQVCIEDGTKTACTIRFPIVYLNIVLALVMNESWPSTGNFCKEVRYRNIPSATGIVCVNYFSFSGISMVTCLSYVILDYVDKWQRYSLKYMFKNIGVTVLQKVNKAPTKFQSTLFILHCQL